MNMSLDKKNCNKNYVLGLNKWQQIWNSNTNNNLHQIKSILGEWKIKPIIGNGDKDPAKLNRKEEVVLTRLHIWHTKSTHSYLLRGEDQPKCIPCQTPLTVRHILTECIDFLPIREKYYKTNNMKELLTKINTNSHSIFNVIPTEHQVIEKKIIPKVFASVLLYLRVRQ